MNTLHCTLIGWVGWALLGSAGGAMAADPLPQPEDETLTQPEIVLSKSQLAAAKAEGQLTDSALSVFAGAAAPRIEVPGTVQAPPAAPQEVAKAAGGQLGSDLREAATELGAQFADRIGGSVFELFKNAGGKSAAPKGGPSAEVIVGKDNRVRVTNTKAKPYCSVCYLQFRFPKTPKDKMSVATAVFVHPRVLLTNAHCGYNAAEGGWADYIDVFPGRDGTKSPFGSQRAMTWYVPTPWVNGKEGDRDYDICWIILPDKTLFNKVGYAFGYQTRKDSELKSDDLNMSGYPGDKNGQQWREFSKVDQVVFPLQYKHFLDSKAGASGSPMYRFLSSTGKRYVVGVNCAEVTTAPVYNIGTRMTSGYFDLTQRYNSMYP